MTAVSVVIATHDEGERIAETVARLLADLPACGEIIVVDDRSADRSTDGLELLDPRVRVHRAERRIGAMAARNLGVRLSRNEMLLFADAHVAPVGAWWAELAECAGEPRVGAAAATLEEWDGSSRGFGLRFTDVGMNVAWLDRKASIPYPVPLLPGFFLAMTRSVFVRCGRFDERYRLWGMEDLDLCVRLWALGYECLVVPSVVVRHYSKHADPPGYQRDWPRNLYNILLFGAIHYGGRRWTELLEFYAAYPSFAGVLSDLEHAGGRRLGAALRASRIRDDDDLFALCGWS